MAAQTTIHDLTAYKVIEVYGRRLYLGDGNGESTTITLPVCTMTLNIKTKAPTLTFRSGGKILQLKGPEVVLVHLHLVTLERKGKEVVQISP